MDKNIHNPTLTIDSIQTTPINLFGKDLPVEYGFHSTPFGECFIATTPRGICAMEFTDDHPEAILQQFVSRWNSAHIAQNQDKTGDLVAGVFDPHQEIRFRLLLWGTEFQLKVWKALCDIPIGKVGTYQYVAQTIGMPKASRAVGSAIAKNNIAFLVPCHRVIQGSGGMGGFKWKTERKIALLDYEKQFSSPLQTQMLFPQELDLRS